MDQIMYIKHVLTFYYNFNNIEPLSLFTLRYYVLYKLPRLKFLDSSQVNSAEIAEAKRVGPFMQVVRPKEDSVEVCQGYLALLF